MSDTLINDLMENLNLWAEEYKGKPISLSLFRTITILKELEREKNEMKGTLEYLSFYLGQGLGDEQTTAEQYKQRILEGINHLLSIKP